MDRAINKKTNKTISAFEVHRNGSYQNLARGEWIAPRDSIYNWEELKDKEEPVHYVSEKRYTNFKGKDITCSPHFAVYPGSLAKTTEESATHKLLKNWLFERMKEDDLELVFSKGVKPHKYENKITLSELDINWNDYEIEVTTKSSRRLRADILLPFNKKHILLGEGIIFEIQLSPQTDNETYHRTILRALHGYSVCWLFEGDFIIEEDNISLKKQSININSFSEQMHFAKKGFVKKLRFAVEEQCRFLDEKVAETNNLIDFLEIKKEQLVKEIEEKAGEQWVQVIDRLRTREAILIKKIEAMEGNPFKALVDNYKEQLLDRKAELSKQLSTQLNDSFSIFEKMRSKLNYPTTFGICPKCQRGYMTKKKGKFGVFYSCSNWSKNGMGCNHIINIKEDEDGENI